MNETGQLSESLLHAILQNAVDAIITIDTAGIIQTANPATEKLFGYTMSEVIGQNVSLLMPSPFRESHDAYIENYLTTGEPKIIGIGREVVGRRKDGSVFPIHLAVSEIVLEQKHLFAGIVRDISDVKNAEQLLEQLNKELENKVRERTTELRDAQSELVRKEKLALLGQVSANISHEIRNPLNAARTSAYYLMNAKSPSPDKTTEHLQRIDRQIEMIDNVVTALTDLAKLPEPKHKNVNLARLIEQTIGSMTLPSKIDVVVADTAGSQQALADENQIAMVIRNLVRNARDAMPDGGTLTISTESGGDHVCVSVVDTGCGISAEDLSRIMDPFYSTKARGMGLGLAIIRAILKKNGGQIQVQSELSKGSTFQFCLPLARLTNE